MTNTRLALQTRLLGVVTASEVDWENDNFIVPALDVPYYKAFILNGANDNIGMDTMDAEGVGIFQVTLLYPTKKGTIPLETMAQTIMNYFVGQKLTEVDTKVKILTQPYYTPLTNTSDRFIGAVSIPFTTIKI